VEELQIQGDDRSIQEAVAALHKLCCAIIWNKKHPERLTMQELLLKPTPALKKVSSYLRALLEVLALLVEGSCFHSRKLDAALGLCSLGLLL
jgi:hypothetical protein